MLCIQEFQYLQVPQKCLGSFRSSKQSNVLSIQVGINLEKNPFKFGQPFEKRNYSYRLLMAFNRLSTVACPFSPKCILSKGFFFWLFFRIFAPLILERTHGKLWIRHIWSCEIEKKGHSRNDGEEKKENAHDGLFGRIVQSVCTFMYKTTTSRIISFLALKHVRTQWITKWSKQSNLGNLC